MYDKNWRKSETYKICLIKSESGLFKLIKQKDFGIKHSELNVVEYTYKTNIAQKMLASI